MVRLSECGPRILIDCPRCGRHGNYLKMRLPRRFGDIGLPDLLARLADCDRALANACEARYDLASLPGAQRLTQIDIPLTVRSPRE